MIIPTNPSGTLYYLLVFRSMNKIGHGKNQWYPSHYQGDIVFSTSITKVDEIMLRQKAIYSKCREYKIIPIDIIS